ncbi:hypothetical protein LINGRAHAP2_LOCUS6745 [Linum grandiflorum]
MGSYYFSYLP